MPPPPTPLTVQTSAITRLLKEQDSYKTELAAQEMRLQGMMRDGDGEEDEEGEEGNREWKVGQEVCLFFCFLYFWVFGFLGGGGGRGVVGGCRGWYGMRRRGREGTKS